MNNNIINSTNKNIKNKENEVFKMKNQIKKIAVITVLLITIFSMNILPVSASTTLNTNQKVSLDLACSKTGYEFTVYQVGTLINTTNPYGTKYVSNEVQLSDSIINGDIEELLSMLDDITLNNSPNVGVFNSTTQSTKSIENLDQGIYYIKATNYPAGIKSVQNSVVALPYYNGSNWIYEIEEIDLATKVIDGTPTTKKEITNSTKNNVNYTDVSLGDTVNFEIKSTTAGSTEMKLASYVISDDMSKGLTLNNDSFNVSLLNAEGEEITDLEPSEYTVNITKQADGQNTLFNVSLTEDYLNQDEFYAEDVYYTSLTYTADLNKYAIVGVEGNPNEELHLEYSNKNGVTSQIKGNTVYVYTYAVKTDKTDEEGNPLSGAEFSLYETKENAEHNTNVIATGVSDENGLVKYYNSKKEEMKLQSGTYYIVETKAPEGYNLHTNVIEISVDVTYGDVFTNGTYVTNSPVDGYASVEIKNSNILLPNTGGQGDTIIYIVGAVLVVSGATVIIIGRKRNNKKTIKEQ